MNWLERWGTEIGVIGGMLIAAIVTGFNGYWVYGPVHRREITHRDNRIQLLETLLANEKSLYQGLLREYIDMLKGGARSGNDLKSLTEPGGAPR